MKRIAFTLAALLAAGCAKVEPVVTRFDGAPLDKKSPAWEQVKDECESKARVAGANMPYTHGRNGDLSYSIDKYNIESVALKGCLAERGYKIEWVKQGA